MTNPLAPQTVIERPYVSVQAVAVRKIAKLEELKEQLRLKKEMLRDSLTNDTEFSILEADAKAAQNRLKQRKAVLMQDSSIMGLAMDIKELSEEKKESQLSLFDTLTVYQSQTNSNTIDLDDGSQYEIGRQYKLRKK